MGATGTKTKEERAMILRNTPDICVKDWFLILALVLLCLVFCAAVFAGEPRQQSGPCDAQSGLAATLNLSQEQCEKLRQLTERFRNDTAATRGRIVEKRFELKRLSEDPKADPYVIYRLLQELNLLEQTLSRRVLQAEADQRGLLTPEQIDKINSAPDGYSLKVYIYRGRRYGGR
jgi:Spy/CpxP family protein refolding chaperone